MEAALSMVKNLNTYIEIKVVLTVLLSIGGFFFGELYNDALIAVFVLMCFDIITGLVASKLEGAAITSQRFGRKIKQGAFWFLAISAGYFVDLTVPGSFVQFGMISWVGINEFISILENMGRMGYRTPQKLLNQLKERRDGK